VILRRVSEGSENARPVAVIIEDDQDTVDLLEVVLTQAGFSVLSADNATDGIALTQQHRPVLATIDVNMPGMDGLEATRRIRARWPDRPLWIIAMTANAMEGDREMCIAAGMDDYVSKPIRPDALAAALRAVPPQPSAAIPGGTQ
jgi:two-component system, OmpR family, response regulator